MNRAFDYAGDFGADYHRHRRLPPQAEEWIAGLRAGKVTPWIKPQDRVFEYGVGFGWNLAALPCKARIGFDVVPGLRQIVETKGISFTSDLASLAEQSFDAILSHHSLEHLTSPFGALQTMLNLSRQGGIILLFVPYEREGKYRRYNFSDRAHHIYSWTLGSLLRLVSVAGAEVLDVAVLRFRFDRAAALLAHKLHGGFPLFRTIRTMGSSLLPEYEIRLVCRSTKGR